jgi:predicted amidophosphoribosyltransferase
VKLYRTDEQAPKWMWEASLGPRSVDNCPQCKGEIRYIVNPPKPVVWRCTSCRVEIGVDPMGAIVWARNLQPWHLGPPDILCSQCGEYLAKTDDGFSCAPCGRRVTA